MRILPVALCFLFAAFIFQSGIYAGSQVEADSLLNVLQAQKDDTGKISTLLRIALAFEIKDYEKAINYATQALSIAQKRNLESALANVYSTIGNIHYSHCEYNKALVAYENSKKLWIGLKNTRKAGENTNRIAGVYWHKGDYQTAIELLVTASASFDSIHDQDNLASSYITLGNIYKDMSKYDLALSWYQKSLVISESLHDKHGIAVIYNNMGLAYWMKTNYTQALQCFQKSLRIREELNEKTGIASSYQNIGIIYYELRLLDKTLKYWEKSLKLWQEMGQKDGEEECLNNIGSVYDQKGDYNKAIDYFKRSLKIKEEIGDKLGIAMIYCNIGVLYSKTSDSQLSLENYLKAFQISDEIGDKTGVSLVAINIGDIYCKMGNYAKALDYVNKGLEIAKEIKAPDRLKDAYRFLSKIYAEKNDFESAYSYQALYIGIKDSIFNKDIADKLTEMQTKYESEKKEKEIELLNKEKLLQITVIDKNKAEIKQHQLQRIAFIIGIGFVLIIVIVIFINNRRIKKVNTLLSLQKLEIEKQKEIVEEKNKEITDSITYAQYIQKAILPPEEYVSKYLPKHFIIFKPRDIVSGDFYWTAEKGNFLNLAVTDCTGHGVPGAFMSMLGIALLNEIINKYSVLTLSESPILANEILNQLREGVIKSLHQSGREGEQKDGMDIAYCILNLDTLELQFAGANNPLYVIASVSEGVIARTKDEAISSNGEIASLPLAMTGSVQIASPASRNDEFRLFEVKGDKMPIGIYSNQKPFTNNIIQLNKGDVFYIFSDGLADQFGGPAGKKFMYKQFKEFLISIAGLESMENQKKMLISVFENWKMGYEQIDDVTVLGMKV